MKCEKCGKDSAIVRLDVDGHPVLCSKCYGFELFGIDCDYCIRSYYEGDRLRCESDICDPLYDVD